MHLKWVFHWHCCATQLGALVQEADTPSVASITSAEVEGSSDLERCVMMMEHRGVFGENRVLQALQFQLLKTSPLFESQRGRAMTIMCSQQDRDCTDRDLDGLHRYTPVEMKGFQVYLVDSEATAAQRYQRTGLCYHHAAVSPHPFASVKRNHVRCCRLIHGHRDSYMGGRLCVPFTRWRGPTARP